MIFKQKYIIYIEKNFNNIINYFIIKIMFNKNYMYVLILINCISFKFVFNWKFFLLYKLNFFLK